MKLERIIKNLETDIQYLVNKTALLEITKKLKDEEREDLFNNVDGKLRRYGLLTNRRYFELRSRESW
jgi:hypothetical protein